jgi:hypothetical protein
MSQPKTNVTAKQSGERPALTMRSLIPFFAIAFGLGWGLPAVLIIFTAQIEAVFGPVSGTNRSSSSRSTHPLSPVSHWYGGTTDCDGLAASFAGSPFGGWLLAGGFPADRHSRREVHRRSDQ